MKLTESLYNGVVRENPAFVLLLGMCPTLATTTSALNGMSMGLATMFVLVCSNLVVSLIRHIVPDMVRIPVFVVVIATFVSALQMLMEAWLPSVNSSLGIFIPLIVVNCLILGRAEAFASKHTPLPSILDGVGMGLGFTVALTLLGIVRELLGSGSVFDVKLLPGTANVLLFVLPPGAFITLGYMLAIIRMWRGDGK